MLSGFRGDSVDVTSGVPLSEDSVTHLERRLYFSTAHFHLRAGCPALAVEVLSKLPNKVIDSNSTANSATPGSTATSSRKQSHSTTTATAAAVGADTGRSLETGIFEHSSDLDFSQPVPTKRKVEIEQHASMTEHPLSLLDPGGGSCDILDWSQPLASAKGKKNHYCLSNF